jgi:BirA family biotin operon repressor/biotin-[acetyl-CoA-carboxylase] ligase
MSDLDIERITGGLAGCIIGKNVLYFKTLDSTMNEAKKLADSGVEEGTVVIADEQTAGRGRFDRAWISPPGEDLMFSVVLKPDAVQMPYVNMAAALSICSIVNEAAGLKATIKWPNDGKVDGRKISGILVESTVKAGAIDYAVLGIGLNVNSDPASTPEISAIATSMHRETGREFDRNTVLTSLLRALDTQYADIRAGRSLTDEWALRMETLGRDVQVRWQDRVEEGLATGVDDQGNLILTQPDGSTKTVIAGEVTLRT